jgi:hypothetical protein
MLNQLSGHLLTLLMTGIQMDIAAAESPHHEISDFKGGEV